MPSIFSIMRLELVEFYIEVKHEVVSLSNVMDLMAGCEEWVRGISVPLPQTTVMSSRRS